MKKSKTLHEAEEAKTGVNAKGEEPMSKKIGNFLSFGGDLLKKGLKKGGQLIGKGIRSSELLFF